MKRVIFTLYEDIDVTYVHEDYNQKKIRDYYDRLLDNKQQYAKSIGVDFKFFTNLQDIKLDLVQEDNFVNINLYKHHLMAELAEEYDEVMYADFDVVFNTDKNIFEELDLQKGIAVKDQNDEIRITDFDEHILWDLGRKNPTTKYFITKHLLGGQECNVINTGTMIGKSEHIKQLKYIERLPEITEQIYQFNDPDQVTESIFYPNNEAIFAYILDHYNVPYQLLEDTWHDIRDHRTKEQPLGNVLHFISKNFDIYFNDKSKVIFSLYVEIPDDKLDQPGMYDCDSINKSKRTQLEMNKYRDQLIQNKQEYAELCNADFLFFEKDQHYDSFAAKYNFLSEYNIVNLYKIHLMYELSKQYDYILYLDFDTMYHRPANFFHQRDCDRHINVAYNLVRDIQFVDTNKDHMDFRSPFIKYWNGQALLDDYDIEAPALAFNTGIVGISRNLLKQLEYFDDIDETLQKMTDLKNDQYSLYPPRMRESFGYDNESIFGYKVFLKDIPYRNLPDEWHYKVEGADYSKEKLDAVDPFLIHFINKKIGWYLKNYKDQKLKIDY